MNREVDSREDVDIVTVSGRIDSSTSPELDSTLSEHAEARKHIILELSGVDYMSSAGIRAIVSALRTCNKHRRKLVLAHPSSRVSEVLQLAGLRSVFEIYDSTGAALGILQD